MEFVDGQITVAHKLRAQFKTLFTTMMTDYILERGSNARGESVKRPDLGVQLINR